MKRVILGTAGHIDHGKTTLVKALTGIDTDRLPEEKARGITIDLGFAHMQAGDLDVGIVDVPGHEGLIRNMLAGATGFDAVLLVIAADEGIMPQTREHLDIARLLGVQRLVVALTKSDLVDADWLELVRNDVAEFLSAAFPAAPVVAVSAVTNAGVAELAGVLAQELAVAAGRRVADLFRMPIDRVFTVRGTGTVVTGTVWSGAASRQDAARILPGEREVRLRGVQTHGQPVEVATAGERAAFALVGLERSAVARGQVLVTADAWQATQAITARVELLPGVELKQRQRVRVYLGTAEVMARVLLLDRGWIQLRLEKPLVARARDRFVLRSYSPLATIGGGVVAELARPRKRIDAAELPWLETLLADDGAARIRAAIELAAQQGCRMAALPVAAGVPPAEAADFARSLPDGVVRIGDACYPAAVLNRTVERLRAAVAAYHKRYALEPGVERAELLGGLPAELGAAALKEAEGQALLKTRGSIVALAGFEPGLSPTQAALAEKLVETLRAAGLMPPTVAELGATFNSREVRPVLRLLEAQGAVSAVSLELYLDGQALSRAIREVRALDAGRPLAAGEFKAALPVSRKYLIPILEYLDRTGVTKREGDLRWILAMEQAESA